jgi:DNA-binding NarL/FixJ family response regulator
MRIIIVDDHPLVVAGLRQLLTTNAAIEVLATCGTAADAWEAIQVHEPDLVVLDLHLADGDGRSLLKRLDPSRAPAVVVLTASDDEDVLLDAVRLGARGVVLKATAPRVLEECLAAVNAGGTWFHVGGVDLAARLDARSRVERELTSRLTSRELEVVRLAATGVDNAEIAESLSIGVGTVKIHLHHVYDKLQLPGRQRLVDWLRERGY